MVVDVLLIAAGGIDGDEHGVNRAREWSHGGPEIADAVHLATARHAGASAIVTNDERMRPIPRLEVVRLADLVA